MTTLEKIRAEMEKHTDGKNHCDEYLDGYNDGMKDALEIIEKYAEQEPCDVAVSRQAVKDLFCRICMENNICYRSKDTCEDLKLFDQLPPVRPQEPKTGHWIKVTNRRGGHECDLCHEYAPSYQSGDEYLTKYCPNCGARMVEPQESEVMNEVN